MTGPESADEITGYALAAGRGDHAAAAALVRATQHDVRRFLTHLSEVREVDDLVQETYLRAWRSLPGFAGRSSARTWLFAIARRVAVDHVRAAVTRPRTTGVADWHRFADETGAPAASGHDDEVTLRSIVDGLSPDRREAFVATQILGLSYAEAARVCGCPVGTIRSRVARAREDLVAAMAPPVARPVPLSRRGTA
ncbi:RNA polymerase sigma factor [Micromonospora yangpuensis]|uniref:RNA polymerase sigma factor n=1 Tax=Micromonospora yangpuensis TaxID=683228 RepID=A0A1C6UPW4_9ACTN|nr:sigma-70 family RNA polymerase sigma factor [Micromonospora yangpuensis]GGM08240.1 RNA polymerase sigma factor [Micromonospora yangpuensis]SCL55963.1 RNA polymerase sigma-70 factor, ECF subfamily [Micromonospora yangpuensis]